MSSAIRKTIMYWVTLLLGIIILCNQTFSYLTGTIELCTQELVVTIVAIAMMINPHVISNAIRLFVKRKTDDQDE